MSAGTRSRFALIWSAGEVPDPHLWTFTLRHLHDVGQASVLWSDLWRRCLKPLGFRGVRVYELHPSGHGLHVHFIGSGFHDLSVVRREIAGRCPAWGVGYGLDVERVTEHAGHYVAKYVSKRRQIALAGQRLWARCAFTGCRTSDVRCVSAVGALCAAVIADGVPTSNMQALVCAKRIHARGGTVAGLAAYASTMPGQIISAPGAGCREARAAPASGRGSSSLGYLEQLSEGARMRSRCRARDPVA